MSDTQTHGTVLDWAHLDGAEMPQAPLAVCEDQDASPGRLDLSEPEWVALAARHANADWESVALDGFLIAVKALGRDVLAKAAPKDRQAGSPGQPQTNMLAVAQIVKERNDARDFIRTLEELNAELEEKRREALAPTEAQIDAAIQAAGFFNTPQSRADVRAALTAAAAVVHGGA